MTPKANNRISRREAAIIIDPIRRSLMMAKTGEVDSINGYPHMIDWRGQWSRIDEALEGWVDCWTRFQSGIDLGPLERLRKKLTNGVMLTLEEIDAALGTLRQQEKALTRLPKDFIRRQTDTELINIELEQLGIKEAA